MIIVDRACICRDNSLLLLGLIASFMTCHSEPSDSTKGANGVLNTPNHL